MIVLEVTARMFEPNFRGGGERYPLELTLELAKTENVVFSYVPGHELQPSLEIVTLPLSGWSLSFRPFLNPSNPLPFPKTFLQIRDFFQAHSEEIEIVHIHNLRTAMSSSWLAVIASLPMRRNFHVLLTDHGSRFAPLPRLFARVVDSYAAVSRFSLSQLQNWAPRPGVVVPPFVPNTLLRIADLVSDIPRDIDLLYMGRLVPWKRADLVIDLIPIIESTLGRGINVVIAGSEGTAEYVSFLRHLAGLRGSKSRVEFVFNPDDALVALLYARARLFVLLSSEVGGIRSRVSVPELAPSTPIEAGVFGTPSIVSSIPGLEEQVSANKTGLLVDPSDTTSAGQSISAILSDEPRWRSLSHNAKEFTRAERTVGASTRILEGWFKRIREGTS